jgi:hypothetical protein
MASQKQDFAISSDMSNDAGGATDEFPTEPSQRPGVESDPEGDPLPQELSDQSIYGHVMQGVILYLQTKDPVYLHQTRNLARSILARGIEGVESTPGPDASDVAKFVELLINGENALDTQECKEMASACEVCIVFLDLHNGLLLISV